MITLYGFARSMNTRKARWALEEARLPYVFSQVDLTKGEQKQAAILRLNPNGRVPVLVEDDFVLWESNAIACHIADRPMVDPLMPEGARERAHLAQWLSWETGDLGPAIRNAFRLKMLAFEPAQHAGLCEATRPMLAILDTHLAERRYMLGDRFSVADVVLGGPVALCGPAAIDLASFPNVRAWLGRLETRPAFQKTRPS